MSPEDAPINSNINRDGTSTDANRGMIVSVAERLRNLGLGQSEPRSATMKSMANFCRLSLRKT